MNEAFLKNRVQAEFKRIPYSITAFATHAQIHSDPRQSFLLTYDDRITLDELDSFVRTGQFRDQPVELMVLTPVIRQKAMNGPPWAWPEWL